jgi:hypothetical protein
MDLQPLLEALTLIRIKDKGWRDGISGFEQLVPPGRAEVLRIGNDKGESRRYSLQDQGPTGSVVL